MKDILKGVQPKEKICTLKNVFLKGNIFQEYALLNLEQEYEHTAETNVQSAFLISLPFHAVIRRLTVSVGGKLVVQGRIVSQEDLEQQLYRIEEKGQTSVTLRSLLRGIYALSIDPLPPEVNVKISVECYVELEYRRSFSENGAGVRLVFPAAPSGLYRSLLPQAEEWDEVPYRFCAELELGGEEQTEKIFSPSHIITTDFRSNHTLVTADFSEMTRDFVLDIFYKKEEKNKVFVVHDDNGVGGLALYSMRAPLKQLPPEKINSCRILLDASGNLLGVRLERAKKTLLEFLKKLPQGIPVQIAVFADEFLGFAEQMTVLDEDVIAEARIWLDKISIHSGIAVEQAFSFFSDLAENEAGVMITSGTALGQIHVVRRAEELLSGKKICFVITDGKSEPPILPRLNEVTDGGVVRSFPEDSAAEKAEEIKERLLVPSLKNVSILPVGGVFDEIIPPVFSHLRLNERVNFAASFRGRVPVKIALSANGGSYQGKLEIEEIREFDNFDLLSLAYGSFRLKRLYDLIMQSPPSVWGNIREEIVKTAVEYQLFCDEVSMLCELPLERKISGVARMDVPILKNRPFTEFADDISALRRKEEKKIFVITAAQRKALLYTLMYARCEDGSFADWNVFDFAGRMETTALCLAALCREGGAYEKAICRATEYLLSRVESGAPLTPIVLFALARSVGFSYSDGQIPPCLRAFWEQKKASAGVYSHADAELPSCTVRGRVSAAARMLIIAKR